MFFYFVLCLLMCSINVRGLICARYILVPVLKELIFTGEGDRQ